MWGKTLQKHSAMEITKKNHQLPLRSFNHLSRVCHDVEKSAAFYRDVLGFAVVKRPSAFEFEGCWLFNYNIGMHLIKGNPHPRTSVIDPKADHVSFETDSLSDVETRLKDNDIEYVKDEWVVDGVQLTQLFFHDPENNMIEICNCHCLPMLPLCDNDCTTRCACSSPRGEKVSSFTAKGPVGAYYKEGPGMLARENLGDIGAIRQPTMV